VVRHVAYQDHLSGSPHHFSPILRVDLRIYPAFAADLESRIKPRDRAEWQKGNIEYWVMEGNRLAQAVAYIRATAGSKRNNHGLNMPAIVSLVHLSLLSTAGQL